MSLNSVTNIFPNATVVGGDLTIPSGDIVSYNPVSTSNPTGAEMVYGLLQTMSDAVRVADYTNLTCTVTTNLANSTTLRRQYVFNVNLEVDDSIYNDLNVKSEPQP